MNKSINRCPVCKSCDVRFFSTARDVEYFSTEDVYEYLSCLKCRSIFLREPPVDKLSIIYPNNYYSVVPSSGKKQPMGNLLQCIKDAFDKHIFKELLRGLPGDSLSCVDIGGGAGDAMSLVRSCDSRVKTTTIIDLNENQKVLAESSGHMFVHKRVEDIEVESKFDFVLMLNIIEHVESPSKVLRKVHELISQNGRCLIKTPNTLSINRRLFQNHYWGGLHAPRHWVLFNKDSFTELANQCGFVVESFKYTQGASQWVASILGSIEKYYPAKYKKPMYMNRSVAGLTLLFAIIDYILLPFKKTDQMIFVLKIK